MKKKIYYAIAFVAMLGFVSCSSVRHTATTVPVKTDVVSCNTADLVVSPQKISYTYYPSKAVKRTGEKNVIKTAVAEALKANGNADVLVGFQYEIKKKRKNIKHIIVEGYPATYKNFQTVK